MAFTGMLPSGRGTLAPVRELVASVAADAGYRRWLAHQPAAVDRRRGLPHRSPHRVRPRPGRRSSGRVGAPGAPRHTGRRGRRVLLDPGLVPADSHRRRALHRRRHRVQHLGGSGSGQRRSTRCTYSRPWPRCRRTGHAAHSGAPERWARRWVTRSVLADVATLRASGTRVCLLTPGPTDLAVMGVNLMNPARRTAVLVTAARTAVAQLAGQRDEFPSWRNHAVAAEVDRRSSDAGVPAGHLDRAAAPRRRGRDRDPPMTAFAVTPALREWYIEDDTDELEYAALLRGSGGSLRLLDGDPRAWPAPSRGGRGCAGCSGERARRPRPGRGADRGTGRGAAGGGSPRGRQRGTRRSRAAAAAVTAADLGARRHRTRWTTPRGSSCPGTPARRSATPLAACSTRASAGRPAGGTIDAWTLHPPPVPSNEPVRSYAPGSPERDAVAAALEELSSANLPN